MQEGSEPREWLSLLRCWHNQGGIRHHLPAGASPADLHVITAAVAGGEGEQRRVPCVRTASSYLAETAGNVHPNSVSGKSRASRKKWYTLSVDGKSEQEASCA